MTAQQLFQPFRLKSLELRNRIVMAPMTRSFSPRGVPTASVADYYARRAEGDPEIEMPLVCLASQSLQEVESLMIASTIGLFLVAETEGGPITGVFTLNDLLRAQAALLE